MADEASVQWSRSREVLTDPELLSTLLDSRTPYDVDWQQPICELDESARLLRLARVKALLPPKNATDEKNTHDNTIENYIRLALQAAGTRETLDVFLCHMQNALLIDDVDAAKMLAQQVFWIWAPAAEIAGLYNHKTELEDVAFNVLYPEESDRIRRDYDQATIGHELGLLGIIESKITALLDESLDPSTPYEINSRPKSNYSVWRKLKSEKRAEAKLFDLLGYRIILGGDEQQAMEQCYVAAAAVIAGFKCDERRIKDYIFKPKASGYKSIHLTLQDDLGPPFEVQIRTRQMHDFTETDSALSHQAYEATYKEIPGKIQKTYKGTPRLYKWRSDASKFVYDNNGQTEGFMEGTILFFREDGNLYRTETGSTALDASFRVHSHRALRTRRVYVNDRLVAYKDLINHGDFVRIEYGPEYPTQPSRVTSMLTSVATRHARDSIEQGKNTLIRDQLRKNGAQIISLMVRELELEDPLALLDSQDRMQLAERMGLASFEELLIVIGGGKNRGKPTRVANWIRDRHGVAEAPEDKEVKEALDNTTLLSAISVPGIEDASGCLVAGCCSEKIHQGDDILVQPSRTDGALKVHLRDCENIRDVERTINCSWIL